MSEIKFGQDVLEQPGANFTRDGIFTNTSKVIEAKLGYNVSALPGWKPSNLVLIMKLAIEGQSFTKDIIIAGDYEWIQNGNGPKVNDYHSTFRVFDIITILRRNGHLRDSWAPQPDGTITVGGKSLLPADGQEWVDITQYFGGAEICFIDYLTAVPKENDPSKMKAYTYRNVTAVYPNETNYEAEQRLKKRFLKDVSNGYVKDYAQPGSEAADRAESTAQAVAPGEAPF